MKEERKIERTINGVTWVFKRVRTITPMGSTSNLISKSIHWSIWASVKNSVLISIKEEITR